METERRLGSEKWCEVSCRKAEVAFTDGGSPSQLKKVAKNRQREGRLSQAPCATVESARRLFRVLNACNNFLGTAGIHTLSFEVFG